MKTFLFISLLSLSTYCFSQSAISTLSNQSGNSSIELSDLPTEKISKISPSKRIFILTNENNSFGKGDFISLVKDNNLLLRALSARTDENYSGVKIIKIYNLELWNQIRLGDEVQIIRGDDSFFSNRENKDVSEEEELAKIQSEDDLFNETKLVEDDLSLDENKKRLIKTDNVVTAGFMWVDGLPAVNSSASSSTFFLPSIQWSFQIDDNIWIEGGVGANNEKDFPIENQGVETRITSFTAKVKYTFAAPFFSYIQPYAGFQVITADSPAAGQDIGTAEAELEVLDEVEKNSIIFGISILKRLVPGWFARADLGTDSFYVGFGLEF